MQPDRRDDLTCKFCEGRLGVDFARKEKMPGFSYFRCADCDMPNIFLTRSLLSAEAASA